MKIIIVLIFLLFACSSFGQLEKYEADGDYHLLKGEYIEAIRFYDKVIVRNDTNSYNYFLRGLCKFKLGDYSASIPDFTKSIELCPKNMYGFWFYSTRMVRVAEDKYYKIESGVSLQHEYYQAYFYRGLAKYNLHDYRGGLSDFSAVIRIDETVAGAYHNRGLCYFELKKYVEAIIDFDKSIEIDDKNGWVYYIRGITQLELGKKEKGCNDLSRAGELGIEEAYKAINHYCLVKNNY